MFYRRKIILAILQVFEGSLSKVSLQKLLFLFSNRQEKSNYDFIPYRFGCFSFSANADLTAMVRHGQLVESKESFTKTDSNDYVTTLTEKDKKILHEIIANFGSLSQKSLIKFTYLNYRYYAINSTIAKDILTEAQYQKVLNARPVVDKTVLYTIGYEGISLEEYLNRLIKNDVKMLIDVRNNPQSMKFGFSKSQLMVFCNNLNIEYLHIPEVGIQSKQRQVLQNQSDYDSLFEIYKKENLHQNKQYQEQILNLLQKNKRVALTCFEANICQCHRKHLAESIVSLPDWNYELKHI